MRFLLLVLITVIAMNAAESRAWDIDFRPDAVQNQFKDVSKELGAAIAYRNLAPAVPLGVTGFDLAVQGSCMTVNDKSGYWKAATNDAPGYICYPTVRIRKGLPLGIDVGGMYSYVSGSDIRLYGFELSKSILDGGIAYPALGMRATWTRLTGVGDLDMQTAGIDASISKGFLLLTPYAGAGLLWVDSRYDSTSVRFDSEKIWLPRGFVGVKVSPLPLVGLTAEIEYAVRPVYSLKLGIAY
jgi:hypothetical protein